MLSLLVGRALRQITFPASVDESGDGCSVIDRWWARPPLRHWSNGNLSAGATNTSRAAAAAGAGRGWRPPSAPPPSTHKTLVRSRAGVYILYVSIWIGDYPSFDQHLWSSVAEERVSAESGRADSTAASCLSLSESEPVVLPLDDRRQLRLPGRLLCRVSPLLPRNLNRARSTDGRTRL